MKMNWQKEKDVEPYKHAIEECIEKGILADYLKRKGSEVVNMLTAEYDYETDIEVQRGEAYDEGREKGKLEEKKNLIKIYMKQNLQLLRFQNC